MQGDFISHQAQFFDSNASKTGILDLSTIRAEIQNEFDALLEVLPDIKGKRFLDLGCGTGRLSLMLALHGAKEVIGIDISKKSIAIANRTAKKNNIKNFKGVTMDFHNIAYKEHFDYVICLNLIHHAQNLDEPFQSIKKSLKKNGKFVIFEFNPLNPLFLIFLWKIGQFRIHANKEYLRSNVFTLSKILHNNGFTVTVYRHALLPTSLYNFSLIFKRLNKQLNKIPVINLCSAYNIFVGRPVKNSKLL